MTKAVRPFGRSDDGEASAKPLPSIQTWPAKEAPERVSRFLDPTANCDWVAFVPAELNAPDVVKLVLRDTVNGLTQTRTLGDGSLVLAGRFVEGDIFPVGQAQPESPKTRKARSGGR